MIFTKNIEEYNPNRKRKILIVFDDTIADMPRNKKLNLTICLNVCVAVPNILD